MIMIDTEDGKKAEFYEPQCPYGNKNRKVSKAKQAYRNSCKHVPQIKLAVALFIKLEKLFYVGMFKFRFRNMDSQQHSFPVVCNISIDSGKDADHGNVCN